MASDIVPASDTWGTANFKPDTGEEVNALWGDGIGADVGWLFHGNYTVVSSYGQTNVAGGGRLFQHGTAIDVPFLLRNTHGGTVHAVCWGYNTGANVCGIAITYATGTSSTAVFTGTTSQLIVSSLSLNGLGTGWSLGQTLRFDAGAGTIIRGYSNLDLVVHTYD